MIGIVVSRADPASVSIGKQLRTVAEWDTHEDNSRPPASGGGTVYRRPGFELRTFDTIHLELEGVASVFDTPRAVIFVSKHAGETGPLLTAHVPGNIGEAAYGGLPHAFPEAAPALLDRVVDAMERLAPPAFDVGIECTHHGPSDVGAPALFVEVGSDPTAWNDPEPAESVASAVLELADIDPFAGRVVAGFGGSHYAPRFTRIVRETDWSLGHIAASWALQEIEDVETRESVVRDVLAKSRADVAVIEGDQPAIRAAIERTETPIVGETWLREVRDTSIDLVNDIEQQLGAIATGTRIGADIDEDAALQRAKIPAPIVKAVNDQDPERAIETVRDHVIAFRTNAGGNRLTGDILVASDNTLDHVLMQFLPMLEARFDQVEETPEEIVLRERVFDPATAADRGVPEGPAFGRLAAGESVTVDGHVVEPDDVHAVEETRIPRRRS